MARAPEPPVSSPPNQGTLLRSSLAVFAGYVGMAVVMMVLYALWPRAPQTLSTRGFHALGMIIGFTSAVAGGYLTAALVPRRETVHALVLVIVTMAMEIVHYAVVDTRAPFGWWTSGLASMALGVMLGSTARRVLPRGFLHRWLRRRR